MGTMDQTTTQIYAKAFNEFAKKHGKTFTVNDLEGILKGMKGTEDEIEMALFQTTCRLCQHEDAFTSTKGSGIRSFLSLVIFRCLFRNREEDAGAAELETEQLSTEDLVSSAEDPEFNSRFKEFLAAVSKVHHRAVGFVQARLDGKIDTDLAKIWGVTPQMVQRWRYQYETRIAELFEASFEGTSIRSVLDTPATRTEQSFTTNRTRRSLTGMAHDAA